MKLNDIYESVMRKHKCDNKVMAICMAAAITAGIGIATVILLVAKSSRTSEKVVDEVEEEEETPLAKTE